MKQHLFFIFSFLLLAGSLAAQNQFRKIDTTMKLGKAGYKVLCNNKNEVKNSITLTPVGFTGQGARDVSFEVRGRVLKTEVDDLNNDGFPDLVLYVYGPGEKSVGNVIGISSVKNESFMPIMFPDIVNDPKLRTGYEGYDTFMLMEGTLMRRFPVYTVDSTGSKPTGMYRQIQYGVVPAEREGLKFKAIRSYDFQRQ
ncbi:MAG TPA: hypothetical protein VJ552_12115 [Sediminibacterium sp.]|nr:hypothetical protein [Sediminibacterium sp.]